MLALCQNLNPSQVDCKDLSLGPKPQESKSSFKDMLDSKRTENPEQPKDNLQEESKEIKYEEKNKPESSHKESQEPSKEESEKLKASQLVKNEKPNTPHKDKLKTKASESLDSKKNLLKTPSESHNINNMTDEELQLTVREAFNKLNALVENNKTEEAPKKEVKTKPKAISKEENIKDELLSITTSEDKSSFYENILRDDKMNFDEEELKGWQEEYDFSQKEKIYALDADGRIMVQDYRTVMKEEEKDTFKDVTISDDKKEIVMNLDLLDIKDNLTSTNTQVASSSGSNFEAMIRSQIVENSSEIVRMGNIILRDNDEGSIKLVLNPENLGSVKIDLSLNDKSITGKIVVQSQEALNAFRDSLDNLKEAFQASGFDNTSFDLSFAGQNFQNSHQNPQNPQYQDYDYTRVMSGYNGEEVEAPEDTVNNSNKNNVNIVA